MSVCKNKMQSCKSCNHTNCGYFCSYAWTEIEKQEYDIEGEILVIETSHFDSWLQNLSITQSHMSGLLEHRLKESLRCVLDPDFEELRHVYRGRDLYYENPAYIVDIWKLKDCLELYLKDCLELYCFILTFRAYDCLELYCFILSFRAFLAKCGASQQAQDHDARQAGFDSVRACCACV